MINKPWQTTSKPATPKKAVKPKVASAKLGSPPSLIEMDGKTYELKGTSFGNIDEALKDYYEKELKKLKSVIQKVAAEAQIVHKRELEKARMAHLKAVVPLDVGLVLKEGIMTSGGSDDIYVYYFLPFKYAPKYTRGKLIKDHEKLRRDVLARFGYKLGLLVDFRLTTSGGAQFNHYHKGCLGTLALKSNTAPKDLPALRDQIEVLLTNINEKDTVYKKPAGLPHVDEIRTTNTAAVTPWSPASEHASELARRERIWSLNAIKNTASGR